jgi:hypothetical protein
MTVASTGSVGRIHRDALAEAEIDERYRECNVGREDLVA